MSPTSINRQLSPFKPYLAHSSIEKIYFRCFRILPFTIRFGRCFSIFQMYFMKLGKYIFELLTNIFEQFNFLVSMHFLRLLSFQFNSDQMALLSDWDPRLDSNRWRQTNREGDYKKTKLWVAWLIRRIRNLFGTLHGESHAAFHQAGSSFDILFSVWADW